MRITSFVLGSAVLLAMAAACQKPAEEPAPAGAVSSEAPAETAAPTSAEPSALPPAASPAAAPPATPSAAGPLASQETNWPGVVVDVMEFRRKGNTLTARVRLRNQGTEKPQAEVNYSEVYVMDLAGGKKYQVLQDQEGAFIAALRSGWKDRWYETMEPGMSQVLWMKFPAPPADVKTVTLQVPGVPPFEDLAIQDS